MSGDDTVLAIHQNTAKATPARWTPLSLLAGLFAISALVDAVSLIIDIARTSASLQQALHPVVVSTGPAGGGLSNAEPMKRMGFDHFIRYWLFNMDIPLQLLLYVLVACWLYQAIENVGARGASSVGRPGRAAICCLIPGINLFSSCFYLDRLWRASIDVHGWEQRSTPTQSSLISLAARSREHRARPARSSAASSLLPHCHGAIWRLATGPRAWTSGVVAAALGHPDVRAAGQPADHGYAQLDGDEPPARCRLLRRPARCAAIGIAPLQSVGEGAAETCPARSGWLSDVLLFKD